MSQFVPHIVAWSEGCLRGLSLNEVATRSGLSHTMVSRVEKRERIPTIDTLLRITGALEVDLAKSPTKVAKAVGSEAR